MKKATFKDIQERYTTVCNLYWYKVKELYENSGMNTISFKQLHQWETTDTKLIKYKEAMDTLHYICILEGEGSNLDISPRSLAYEFMHEFYSKIYQTEE